MQSSIFCPSMHCVIVLLILWRDTLLGFYVTLSFPVMWLHDLKFFTIVLFHLSIISPSKAPGKPTVMRIMPGDFTTLLNSKKFHGHGNKEQDFLAVSARPTWTTRDTPWTDIQGVFLTLHSLLFSINDQCFRSISCLCQQYQVPTSTLWWWEQKPELVAKLIK